MVKNQALADFLKQCGIELGQGWNFGKPMSTEDAFPSINMGPKGIEPSDDLRSDLRMSLLERLAADKD
jgi:hypothetical protein|tara:strand:- start:434 stop:637 length:204 start_codon:yes stop_codon:yes gene_type:complete